MEQITWNITEVSSEKKELLADRGNKNKINNQIWK